MLVTVSKKNCQKFKNFKINRLSVQTSAARGSGRMWQGCFFAWTLVLLRRKQWWPLMLLREVIVCDWYHRMRDFEDIKP
jgi:hypothetical protein